jgi:hypothetical protein
MATFHFSKSVPS